MDIEMNSEVATAIVVMLGLFGITVVIVTGALLN